MHISDWFPTILELAGVIYNATEPAQQLDGVSHAQAIIKTASGATTEAAPPRTHLLYNAYTAVAGRNFDVNNNANAAVRDERYKLIHAFVDNKSSLWYPYNASGNATLADSAGGGDDDAAAVAASSLTNDVVTCQVSVAMKGNFSLMLFDLEEDPYETRNLYGDPQYAGVQVSSVAVKNWVVMLLNVTVINSQ